MKDIVITSKRIKFEIAALLTCVLIAFVANVWAVYTYHAPLSEILTSLHYVLAAGLILYFCSCCVRFMGYLLLKFIRKPKSNAAQSNSD